MSGWLIALREVYDAGGQTTAADMVAKLDDITSARIKGFLTPGHKGAGPHLVQITQRGIDLIEGRLTLRTLYDAKKRNGRPPDSHRRVVCTWLMALPRTNEVRLS